MLHNQDNNYTAEGIGYIIQKSTDTYILPAATATFIALLYFAYKWGRKISGKKPLTIFNVLYVGDDSKREPVFSNVLTEPNSPANVIQPMTVSAATLTQLRNKLLLDKMPAVKGNNTVFNKEIAKLHRDNIITSQNIYAYPLYELWGRSDSIKCSTNIIEGNELIWNYDDIIYPSGDISFKNTDLSSKTKENDFVHKHNNKDSANTRKHFDKEVCVCNINTKTVKNTNPSEIFSSDKKGRHSLKEYYRICYDCEESIVDSNDFAKEIFENQANSTSTSDIANGTSRSENINSPINKNNFDDYELSFEDFKSYNGNDLTRNENSTNSDEKAVLEKDLFENYWQIA